MAALSKVAAAAALAALLPAAVASPHTKSSFAVLHFDGDGPLLEARMDPVVQPGEVSGHVHTIQGGNAFALTMGNDFAKQATCTTSRVKRDLSNYWAPKLYFQSPDNGTFYDVPLYYMNVYYFFDNTDDDLVAFPPGFRMVSGDPGLRSPPVGGAGLQLDASKGPIQPVDWVCPQNTDKPAWPADSTGLPIGMQSNVGGEGVGFPNKNCDGTYSPMRADIHFPSCYNPQAGLDNFKNNTAWPSVNNQTHNWNCPEGYIHVPHLFFELYWDTQKFAGQWKTGGDSQPFVLSNGDPTGYSLHADFISGWDTDALQYVIDNCDAGDAGMDTCTGIPGGVVAGSDKAPDCKVQAPFQEVITGAMDALPGCNPIAKGPEKAAMVKNCNIVPQLLAGASSILTGTSASSNDNQVTGSGSGSGFVSSPSSPSTGSSSDNSTSSSSSSSPSDSGFGSNSGSDSGSDAQPSDSSGSDSGVDSSASSSTSVDAGSDSTADASTSTDAMAYQSQTTMLTSTTSASARHHHSHHHHHHQSSSQASDDASSTTSSEDGAPTPAPTPVVYRRRSQHLNNHRRAVKA